MCPINQANAVASAPTVTGPVLPRDSDYFWDSVQNRNSFAVFESDRNSSHLISSLRTKLQENDALKNEYLQQNGKFTLRRYKLV